MGGGNGAVQGLNLLVGLLQLLTLLLVAAIEGKAQCADNG